MAGQHTTVGRLLFDDIVPEEYRSHLPHGEPIGDAQMKGILQEIAEKEPHRYRDVSHGLLKLGSQAASETESSFGLDDLISPFDKAAVIKSIEDEEDRIFARKDLTPEQRDNELIKIYARHSNELPERSFQEAMKRGSNLAKMVASGARGNKSQLNSSIGADMLVVDSNSNPVPVPLKRNYAEGLSPAEYFAGAYGTRRGLISTKFAVQDAGFLGKQLSAAAHDLVVTEKDCGANRGIPTTPDDKDNVGATLLRSAGGHPAGSHVTARILKDLRDKGVKQMFVRSPLTCGAANGLCAACAGVRERNRLPHLMETVGIAASSALAEPLSQGSLSEKHSGGVAAASGKAMSGFARVNNLVQVPETFPGGAAIAQQDGVVSKIEKAPQGGHYVTVGGQNHYVPPDRELKVKRGDELEAGDVLSDGIPNPAEIVKHKGIGEGRMYFTNAMQQAFKDNNLTANRRNVEVIARAVVNHVNITHPDGLGDHLPDDTVEYHSLERNWQPREGTQQMKVQAARGMYLEKPVLHYTIGTRITPRIQKTLLDAGETHIHAHSNEPGFQPSQVRLMEIPAMKNDWMAQMAGSYLKKNIVTNVQRGGASSDIHGTSFLPALAHSKDFGKPPGGKPGF